MAAESGRTNSRVDQALLRERPFEFNFFQAVRLLSRIYPRRRPVGGDSLPSEEVVRFQGYHALVFFPSAVMGLEAPAEDLPEDQQKPPRMTIGFMGLTGRQGVLPFHYTEFIIARRYQQDTAAADFFDLFLHRLVSFFYRAWEKHSIAAQYEQELLEPERATSGPMQYVLHLVGMSSERMRQLAPDLDPQALVFYGGLLSQRPHSAAALEALLGDYFQVPVRIAQLRGRWFTLAPDEYTDMQRDGVQNALGEGACAGDAVWNPQAMVRLHVGPLTRRQFNAFLPGEGNRPAGNALPRLLAWTSHFLDRNIDFDIQLYLRKQEVPEFHLWDAWDPAIRPVPKGGAPEPPALGLSTWLKTSEFEQDADDVVLQSRL